MLEEMDKYCKYCPKVKLIWLSNVIFNFNNLKDEKTLNLLFILIFALMHSTLKFNEFFQKR